MSGPDVLEAEGPYVRHSSKEVGLIPFQPRRLSQGTRLTICELHTHDEGVYVVYNVGDSLHIAPYDATEQVGGLQGAWYCFSCWRAWRSICTS